MNVSGKNQTVVIFDLDGTVTRHDTYLRYLLGFLQRRPLRFVQTAGLPVVVARFKLGLVDNTYVKVRFLQAILEGVSRAEIDQWSADFIDRLLGTGLRPQAMERIERHRKNNDQLILATASLDFYAHPLGKRLGFDHVVCTEVAWDKDNRLQGELNGANCYGEQKLTAIRMRLGGMLADSYTIAYSDHHSDLPLLLMADQGIAVNPTPLLARYCGLHGLPIEDWG